jgi:hypothetical protein
MSEEDRYVAEANRQVEAYVQRQIDLRQLPESELRTLVTFTNAVVDDQINGDRITPANEGQYIEEAKQQAEAYAEARRQKHKPRSTVGSSAEETSIREGVLNWLQRKRGPQSKK